MSTAASDPRYDDVTIEEDDTLEHTLENAEESIEEQRRRKSEKNKKKKANKKKQKKLTASETKEETTKEETKEDVKENIDEIKALSDKEYTLFVRELESTLHTAGHLPFVMSETIRATRDDLFELGKAKSIRWKDMIPVPDESPTIYDEFLSNKDKKRRNDFFDKYSVMAPLMLCATDPDPRENIPLTDQLRSKCGSLMKQFGFTPSESKIRMMQIACMYGIEENMKTPSKDAKFLINGSILFTLLRYGLDHVINFNAYPYFFVYQNLFNEDLKYLSGLSIDFLRRIYLLSSPVSSPASTFSSNNALMRKIYPLYRYGFGLSKLSESTFGARHAVCCKVVKGYFFIKNFSPEHAYVYMPDSITNVSFMAFHLQSILPHNLYRIRMFTKFLDVYQVLYNLPPTLHYEYNNLDPEVNISVEVHQWTPITDAQWNKQEYYEEHRTHIEEVAIPEGLVSGDIKIVSNTDYVNASYNLDKAGRREDIIPVRLKTKYKLRSLPSDIIHQISSSQHQSSVTHSYGYKKLDDADGGGSKEDDNKGGDFPWNNDEAPVDGPKFKCHEIHDGHKISFYFIRYDKKYDRALSWCVVEMRLTLTKPTEAQVTPLRIHCYNCTFHDIQVYLHVSHELSDKNINDYEVMSRVIVNPSTPDYPEYD